MKMYYFETQLTIQLTKQKNEKKSYLGTTVEEVFTEGSCKQNEIETKFALFYTNN